MADGDYICVYRQFFEEFAKSSEIEDSRPMRLNLCNLLLDELIGEIMQSCVNFLTERQCPNSLIVPLTRIVAEELLSEAKKQPEEVNNLLKLNKKTHEKISEVCLRYTDNEKLSSLPAPVPQTPYSTHSTKHTRRRMEDRHICLPRFNTLHGIECNSEAEYYAIFDGHAGAAAASFAASHLHQFLAESRFYPKEPVSALLEAYEKTESRFNSKNEECGTTALAILNQPEEKNLTVSWVGDSQALLVTKDSYFKLVDPHKPERLDERKRIENLGGFVLKMQNTFRVNGELAISRAIGDKKHKPFVSAEPEIRVFNLTGAEHFVVMGSDGLWDVVEPMEVIETVYFELKNSGGRTETVAKRLVDLAKENNSADNISVIVFFLTNPQEISNCSVDVTGHRPKVAVQHGLIMEANYESSNSALNGIYETSNGMHHNFLGYEDQMRNDSDEDLGPETNVDALDDVLVVKANNNNNPFAATNDCWQQKAQFTTETAGKLIKFPGSLEDSREDEADRNEFQDGGFGDSIVKMSGDIGLDVERMNEEIHENDFLNLKLASNDSNKKHEEGDEGIYDVVNVKYKNVENHSLESPVRDNGENLWKEEAKSNKFSMDDENMHQETIIERNYPDALDVKNSNMEENEYVSEIARTEMTDKSGMDLTNLDAYKVEMCKTELEQTGSENAETADGFDGVEDNECIDERHSAENFSDEPFAKRHLDSPETIPIPEEHHKTSASTLADEAGQFEETRKEHETSSAADEIPETEPEMNFFAGERSPNGDVDSYRHSALSPATFNELGESDNDQIFATQKQETEIDASQKCVTAFDAQDAFPPVNCSATDVFEADQGFSTNFSKVEPEIFTKNEIDPKPDLLVPTAPAPEEEIKDEIVGESGGEVEDSEDDEWNYIKVGPGVDAPTEDQQKPDLVSTEEQVSEAKTVAMNSPLNPDAAEFIPVSPMSTGEEDFRDMGTPVKNVPEDLTSADIVASSPNWMTMGNISIPEESAFLNEIKSRPSNVEEEFHFTQRNNFDSFKVEEKAIKEEMNKEIVNDFGNYAEPEKSEEELKEVSREPYGIELAKDMTGSFIDPSTMTDENDIPQQMDSYVAEIQEPIIEKKSMFLTSEIPLTQEADVLHETKYSSESFERISAPVIEESNTSVMPKPTAVELDSSPDSDTSTVPIASVQASPLLELDVEDNKKSNLPSVEMPVEHKLLSTDAEICKPAELHEIEKSEEKLVSPTAKAVAAVAGVVGVAGVAGVSAALKKDDIKPATKPTATKTTKPGVTKTAVNDVKALGTAKKPATKPTVTAKTTSSASSANVTNTTRSKATTKLDPLKTTAKSFSSVSSTVNKVSAARPKLSTTNATATKTPLNKTTASPALKSVTAPPKPATKATTATLAPKPKSRVSSAPTDRKTTMNGDIKTSVAAKKPTGTSSMTTTRVSLTNRPSTAPTKPSATPRTLPTTMTTTTRTITAKPRTAISNSTPTTTSTVTTAGRISSVSKRTTIGSEKQAKEMANRLTSKAMTLTSPKTSGTTPTKTKRTVTTTTTKTTTKSTPSKTKSPSKTENKADTIVDKTVEFIQSESEKHLIENTKDINLINSIASD